MDGTQDSSHIGQLGCEHRICGESGILQRNKHGGALFCNPNQGVRMAMYGDNFWCLLDDDGLKNIDTLIKSKQAGFC